MIRPDLFTLLSPASLLLTEALQRGQKRQVRQVLVREIARQDTGAPLWADWHCSCSLLAFRFPRNGWSWNLCTSKTELDHSANCFMTTPFRLTFWALFWGCLSDLKGQRRSEWKHFPSRLKCLSVTLAKGGGWFCQQHGPLQSRSWEYGLHWVRSLVSAPSSWSSLRKATTLVIFRSAKKAFFFPSEVFLCLLCFLSVNSLEKCIAFGQFMQSVLKCSLHFPDGLITN